MQEHEQAANAQEYQDKQIAFESNAVQHSYQSRMKDSEMSLSMPEVSEKETDSKREGPSKNQQTKESKEVTQKEKKTTSKNPQEKNVQKKKQEQKKTDKDDTKSADMTETEYYSAMAKSTSLEEDFGFSYDEFEEEFDFSKLAEPVRKQIEKNEEEISKAEVLGADKEDVEDMRSFDKEQGKNYYSLQRQKEKLEFEPNPWLNREITREQKEILNTLQRFGKTVEKANLSFNAKGKEVYKGITTPLRKLSRFRHGKAADRIGRKLEKQKSRLTRAIERADETASIKRNKIRQKKGVALEVEAYRSVRDQRRINRLKHIVDRTVVAINTEKAMIDRSIAYEARLDDKISRTKQKQQDIKDLLDRQPTKEERMVLQKEKAHEKTVAALEADIRKRNALARAAELDEMTKAAKAERETVKEQIKQIKKPTVLESKIQEADVISEEKAMAETLAYLEKQLMNGKSVVVEAEVGKFRAYKELNGEMKLERWNDKKEVYEETSKVATISAFAKEQKTVARKVNELFEGNAKPAPVKVTEDRSREE